MVPGGGRCASTTRSRFTMRMGSRIPSCCGTSILTGRGPLTCGCTARVSFSTPFKESRNAAIDRPSAAGGGDGARPAGDLDLVGADLGGPGRLDGERGGVPAAQV